MDTEFADQSDRAQGSLATPSGSPAGTTPDAYSVSAPLTPPSILVTEDNLPPPTPEKDEVLSGHADRDASVAAGERDSFEDISLGAGNSATTVGEGGQDDGPPLQVVPPPIDLSTPITPSQPTGQPNGGPRSSIESTVHTPTSAAETTTPQNMASTSSLPVVGRPRSSTSSSLPGASHLSAVLVISSLESIANSKEAKRSQELLEATRAALTLLKGESGAEPGTEAETVFEPLRLACGTRSPALMVTALDCIGKLVSYSFFNASNVSSASPRAVSRRASAVSPAGLRPLSSAAGAVASTVDLGGATSPAGERPPSPVAASSRPDAALAEEVTATICDCFTDAACPDAVQLQIVKALLALILVPTASSSLPGPASSRSTLQIHQSGLLRAVRTVYNIFLLSRNPTNQAVAQGALSQIVSHVFGRVERGEAAAARMRDFQSRVVEGSISGFAASGTQTQGTRDNQAESEPTDGNEEVTGAQNEGQEAEKEDGDRVETEMRLPESPTTDTTETTQATDAIKSKPLSPAVANSAVTGNDLQSATTAPEPAVTLESFERHNSFDGVPERDSGAFMTMQDYYVKDAFLVFRALCKLSMKPLGSESERDLKSHAMRSKLLSLHLILSILSSDLTMFTDPSVIIFSASTRERTPFIQAIKQYLCLSLSRNAVSSVLTVFELSCEIFWKVLSGMRTRLKKEIEVLLNEIFLPILDMRNSTVKQKSILLTALGRVFHDPQALVEIYLNYDCDRTSLDNIYERFMNIVTKLATTQYTTSTTSSQSVEMVGSPAASHPGRALAMTLPPSLSTTSMSQGMSDHSSYSHQAVEAQLKRQSLECLVAALKSLVTWAGKGAYTAPSGPLPTNGSAEGLASSDSANASLNEMASAGDSTDALSVTPDVNGTAISGRSSTSTPDPDLPSDDPGRFETAKYQKTTLLEGIRQFNFKPKRGIKFLIGRGFIRSPVPKDVARFLLQADGLNKAMIGEYLGEGDSENIETMHAFIDFMDFTNMKFTEAMRLFLQAFRLPGEAQKIDRFMLKFAERYFQGNPSTLANAETAYVLAFSIIMLNTDAHSPQIKNRMTKQEFIRNNRGINQGADLPEEYLSAVYDEIINDEIRMKDEVEAAVGNHPVPSGLAGSIATVGRDLQKEAYVLQSAGMANKSEALFRTLLRGQRRGGARAADRFFEASHFEHVRPMFEVVWMPILAGIADPLQNSDDINIITLSLTGFKQAIKIVCLFDLELERNAFVTTLAKFTFLNNLGEMKPKNVEAIKALLDIAMVDGNYLKGSWKEVLTCVSQLERFQLISRGVDARSVPDLGRRSSAAKTNKGARAKKPSEEVTGAAGATHITHAADMIFSSSHNLSVTAIVDFVQALSKVSWEEIQASGLSGNPRTFCLQKLVEISYYNMGRIRLEWSQIWEILGAHFNQVCCHSNANVSFFALDSLRQLAMRFLEKEELANFKFQKDFLRPFEYTMVHNNNADARDMVLQCLNQMIAARVDNLRSGWRTMFGVFSAASKVLTERVATQAFDIVQRINKEHFSRVVEYGSFADLTVCITDFCKISKYQKISLHAIEMLRGVIPAMLNCPECPLSQAEPTRISSESVPVDDPMIKFWFPVLFGLYDIIMNGEDLEVRKRALDYLFETLKKHGGAFPPDFWDSVCKEVLFPIFAVLRSRNDVSRFSTQEDMSVWLSTTMIQALRNLIDLYTFYFDTLGRLLDRLLDLLCECICQENDTLARIGTSCLQQLLEKNVRRLDAKRWEQVISTFINLFQTTTAYQLFDDNLRMPTESDSNDTASSPTGETPFNPRFVAPTPLSPMPEPGTDRTLASQQPMAYSDRKKVFRQIIVKCVLQLLLIETTNELLSNTEVYERIPPADLLRLLAVIDNSYKFAKRFNADKDLRMGLWKVGFMKQLPNLLKQESSSAVTLVQVILRMYADQRPDHVAKRKETVKVFVPLGLDVLAGYVSLDPETQARNVTAWTPVVAEVLQGFAIFEREAFLEHLPSLYPLLVGLLERDIASEVRENLHSCLVKVGTLALNVETSLGIPPQP